MLLFAFASLLSCFLAAPIGQPCGENEVLACLPCSEESCTVPYNYDRSCIFRCHLGCGCKAGHVRHDYTNECVSMYLCDLLYDNMYNKWLNSIKV